MAAERSDAERAAELYARPLEDFTEARNALAKELREAGDPEQAAAVKKLRKPSVAAWALNRASASEPKAAEELLAAATDLEQSQSKALEGGDAKALRRAMARQTDAIEALVDAAGAELAEAGRSSSTMLDRARETLRAAITDHEVREALAEGRLAEDHQSSGFGSLTAAPPGRGGGTKRKREQSDAAARNRAGQRTKKAEQAVKASSKRVESARSGVEGAEKALEAARAKLVNAEREQAEVETEARAARAELDRLG